MSTWCMFTLYLKLGCVGVRPHAVLTLISTFEMRERYTVWSNLNVSER